MNKQRKTSHILNVFQYDADGHVVLPASLTLGIVPGAEDNSGKVPSTAWVRGLLTTTGNSLVPTNRTITINGTSYDLSSNRSWSIDTGVLTASAGSGISLSVVNQNLNIVNTGLLTGTAGTGISVSTVNQNLNIVNTGLLTGTAGAGISVTTVNQNLNIVNTGLLTASSGLGISVTTVGQNLNIVNTGILTASAGAGVSVSVVGQNLNIVNSGILTATAGAGISLSVVSGNLNIVNTITDNNQLANGAGYATTGYVSTQINNLVAGAPGLLDTLDELAAALGDDPSFATTITTSIATKVPQTRTITINGTSYDLSANRSWTINSMVYPSAGIAVSTGTAWGTSITDNSSNWNTAFGWGNHASAGYLTTSSAASTYVPVSGYSFGTTFTLGTMYVGTGEQFTPTTLLGVYSNGYAYKFPVAGVQAWLGLGSLAYSSATIPTNNNQLTNGAGYITGYTETDTLASVTARGASTSTNSVFTGGLQARKNQSDNNYTTAALWTESYGNTTTGVAFHISGVVGKFLEMRTNGILYWENNQVVTNTGTWGINVTGTSGSISGYNNPTTGATANTIAYRDSGGDLYARYMFAVHFNQSGGNSENPTIGQIWTQNTTDNYVRKSTPAHFISQLGLITTSNIGSQSVNYANSTNLLNSLSNYLWSASTLPSGYNAGIQTSFVSSSEGFPSYGSVITNRTYTGSQGGTLQLYTPYGPAYGGTRLGFRSGIYETGEWSGWKYLLNDATDPYAANMNQYVRSTDDVSFNRVSIGGTSNSPINITGAAHKYLTINPGNGYEAMVRYIGGGSGSSWYVGKRTSSQLVGTQSFHFYSEEASATVGGIDPSGNMIVTGSMRAPIFYDSQDTGYYLDPNSGANLYGGNGSFTIQGTWPQLRIAQNDGTPDASINYDAGSGYRKWNVGPGAGEAEGDEFGFAVYAGTRGTLYSTPLRINALTGYVQIGDRDNPAYQLDVSGYGYFRDNIGVATTPRTDSYKISMGGSIHLNGNSVDYVGSLYLQNGPGVHLQGNTDGSYGSLQITQSKNGWSGIYFTASGNTLMSNNNEVGHYQQGVGWKYRWYQGTMYVSRGTTGGSTEYIVLDSGNYTGTLDGRYFFDYGFTEGYPGTNANSMPGNRSAFTYSNGAPLTGCVAHFGAAGYGIQLNGDYGGDSFSMRSRNGDNATWRPWKRLLTDYNYNSYALPLSGGELSGPLYVGTTGSGVYTTHWKDGGGSYQEAVGNSTATRKLRLQSFNGSSAYAQWFMDGGNMQIYGDVAGVRNFVIDSTTAYIRHNGADKLWGGSDGTRNSGWAYHNNNDTGLHWPNNGWHLMPASNSDFRIYSGNSSNTALRFETTGTTRGYVYAENDNTIGFLTNGRGWAFRTYSNGDARVYGYLYVNGAGTSSSIMMADSDEGQREIHCNSNRIGFLNQSGSWGSWCDDSGNWLTGAGVYAGIFYDYDNGGYYLDPNSTSNLLHIQMPHRGNGTPNILVNNGGSENWRAIQIEGGSGNLGIGKSDGGRSWSGRVSLAMHVGASESFRVHSDGWDSLFEVWGSSGYARLKGSLEVGSDVYLGTRGTWLSSWLNQNVTTGASPSFSEVTAGYHRSYYLTGRYDVSVDHTYGIYFSSYVDYSYAIFRESGAWNHPYPDLRIAFHTGIKIGAYYGYNGTRFYNNSDMATITASVNDGDNNFRGYYDIIAYASDKRLKENIKVIDNAVDKVKQLTGMTYTWNRLGTQYGWTPSNEREAGVFAQDVQAVLPEAVKLAPFDNNMGVSKSGENFLTVKYEKIVPLLIEAIKEQQLQIEKLQNKLDNVLSSR